MAQEIENRWLDRLEGTNVPRSIEEGNAVLYVADHGEEPRRGFVSRVTKTQFRVTLAEGEEVDHAFRRNDYFAQTVMLDEEGNETSWCKRNDGEGGTNLHFHEHETVKRNDRWNHKRPKVYHLHDEVLDWLTKRHEAAEEKREQGRREREAREQREADELAEVKAAFGGSLFGRIRMQDTMPDGSRQYIVDLPIKPDHEERKKGWERIWVSVRDCKDMDWTLREDVERVEMAYTYQNGSSSSFGSVSTSKHDTDEDALWAAVKYAYHSW